MVVGFVNSGIMELHQAIGVIMGSNVGTTVTSWILSLSGLQGDSFLDQYAQAHLLQPGAGLYRHPSVYGQEREEKGRRHHS